MRSLQTAASPRPKNRALREMAEAPALGSGSLRLVAPGPTDRICRYSVAHAIPGRVRLRLASEDAAFGPDIAARAEAHSSVKSVRWSAASRSLTVQLDRNVSIAEVLRRLPAHPAPATAPGERPAQPLWRQFLLPALSVGAAFTGVGLPTRIAIGLCATPIARRAVGSLLARNLSIDVLDATAVGLLLVTGDTLAAGVSVSLIEVGERIRRRASGRARRVLRGWMGAESRGVRMLRSGSEPRVPLAMIKPRDRVVVYPGETIPVDGYVVAGSGSVDNRTWTGETLPTHLSLGSVVLAGSALSDGRVVLDVTATGAETRAGLLAAAIEDAIAADTRVSDMAKRIANKFVLPVFLASGLVYIATRDLSRLVAMLIIDFGTGVRISIPTAVLTTMIAGARSDVLFKQGRGVEELARVDTIVFDKTGTLTTGRPSVMRVVPTPGFDAMEVLRLAAAAEGHLPHPIARAIRRSARHHGLELPEPTSARYQPGGGVLGKVEGREVLVGDRRLLERHGVPLPSGGTEESSLVLVAVDGRLAARVQLRDQINETAQRAVADLRQSGISELWLATGDHPAAARSVSRQLKLDGFQARLMPEQKVALVRHLRERGRVVAVVGDGINDAAAMAEANVGIAVQLGADLARETAEVVLLSDNLQALVHAVRLSRGAMQVIQQNIGLVVAPNAVGMGFATMGLLNPLLATVVNNGSTIFASVNALRPLRYKP